MAKSKGKGKIHPKSIRYTRKVHHSKTQKKEKSPSPLPPPPPPSMSEPDHGKIFNFQPQTSCFNLIVSLDCNDNCETLPILSIPPAKNSPSSLAIVPYEPPTKNSKHSSRKKRKRIGYNTFMKKKIETLAENLNLVPFSPKKSLDLEARKCLLTHLGIWDFLHLDFNRVILPGIMTELVANYNPKKPLIRASLVNGYTIDMRRNVIASALHLPTKRRVLDRDDDVLESGVVLVSEEEALFLEEVIWSFMVLKDDDCEVPDEVMRIVGFVRERKVEKVDWACLVWLMMKRELLKGKNLRNCYYGSHLQLLLEGQSQIFFYDSFQNLRFLEMRSAISDKGKAEDEEMQLLEGNENVNREIDLSSGEFGEEGSVGLVENETVVKKFEGAKKMDGTLLGCGTVGSPCLEVYLVKEEVSQKEKFEGKKSHDNITIELIREEVAADDEKMIGEQMCTSYEEAVLEVEHESKLMMRLFDEMENKKSEELVKKEVSDDNVVSILETKKKEETNEEMQVEGSSEGIIARNDNLHVDTHNQLVGFVLGQEKGEAEFQSEAMEHVCDSDKQEQMEEVCEIRHFMSDNGSKEASETWLKVEDCNTEGAELLDTIEEDNNGEMQTDGSVGVNESEARMEETEVNKTDGTLVRRPTLESPFLGETLVNEEVSEEKKLVKRQKKDNISLGGKEITWKNRVQYHNDQNAFELQCLEEYTGILQGLCSNKEDYKEGHSSCLVVKSGKNLDLDVCSKGKVNAKDSGDSTSTANENLYAKLFRLVARHDNSGTESSVEVEEDQVMDGNQLRTSIEQEALEMENGTKELMLRLNENENEDSNGLVKEVCGVKLGALLDLRQKEDTNEEMQIGCLSDGVVAGKDDLRTESQNQPVCFVLKQDTDETEFQSHVLVEENNGMTSEHEATELVHQNTNITSGNDGSKEEMSNNKVSELLDIGENKVDLVSKHDISVTGLGSGVLEGDSIVTGECICIFDEDTIKMEHPRMEVILGHDGRQIDDSEHVKEDHTVTGERICTSNEDMMEMEHESMEEILGHNEKQIEKSKQLVKACDSKIGASLDPEDTRMDMQIDGSSEKRIAANDDLHSSKTSFQPVGLVVRQAKCGRQLLSEVVIEENNISTSEQARVTDTAMELEHKDRLSIKASVTMDDAYAKCKNQRADFALVEKGIQGLAEKPSFLQAGEQNVQQDASFGGGGCATEAQVVDAIVLELEEKQERKHKLGGNYGSEELVSLQHSLECVEDVEAHSRKSHFRRAHCHDLSKDLAPPIKHSYPVHGVRPVGSDVVHRNMPHPMIDHSSLNSVSPGSGMHFGTGLKFYANKIEPFLEPLAPVSNLHMSFPGSFKRKVSYNNDAQYEDVNATGKTSDGQLLDLDFCSEKVELWVLKLRTSAYRQCQSLEAANACLEKRLAEQIKLNQRYENLMQQEQLKRKREISKYERELHLMAGVLKDYREAVREMQKSSAKRARRYQQPEESLYRDHPDGNGKVITVTEWVKVMQERQCKANHDVIRAMMSNFQHIWVDKLQEHLLKLDKLCNRLSGCGDSLNILEAKTSKS